MNVFHRFTRRSLEKNPTRTLVTIIGIILSMALLTAVIEGGNSGIQYLVRGETALAGAYHGLFRNVPAEEVPSIAQTPGIDRVGFWRQAGWAEIENSSGSTPYLCLEDMGADTMQDLVSVRLVKGRLPENDRELILPDNIFRYGVELEPGDTLALEVGSRRSTGGQTLGQNQAVEEGEFLSQTEKRIYTLVGVYERLDPRIEPYDAAGFTALTMGGGTGACTVFFTVKHPSRFYSFMASCELPYVWEAHRDLLSYSGAFWGGNLTTAYFSLVAILVGLIGAGSILLIYNAFSISISQRTKQFGILKSVGATRKQLRGTVLYEALLLSLIGIPLGAAVGCLGIGITLYCLRDSFRFILSDVPEVQMRLVVSWPGLGISALLCLLTTLVSAWIPARRALSVSPMEAIRQSRDTRIRPREVKTGKLCYKLFGFEGMLAQKSFKRNRKQYRVTILSLTLSVTLFLSASSFCAYMQSAIGGLAAYAGYTSEDIEYRQDPSDQTDPETRLKALAKAPSVQESAYFRKVNLQVNVPVNALASKENDGQEGKYSCAMELVFVQDTAFAEICRQQGLNPARFMDKENPQALLCNDLTMVTYSGDGGGPRVVKSTFMKAGALPVHCEFYSNLYTPPEGYELMEITGEGSVYEFYPTEYAEQWLAAQRAGEAPEMDTSKALRLPQEEMVRRGELTIGGLCSGRPFFLSEPSELYALLPWSALETYAGEGGSLEDIDRISWLLYSFIAPDHAGACAEMEKLLPVGVGVLHDEAENQEQEKAMVTVVRVFSYGFIALISLIAMANVFNTISTGVLLRRREFATLRSVGLSKRGFGRMLRFECLIYGYKGLFWGLLFSAGMSYLIFQATDLAVEQQFYMPWGSVAVAVGSVFAVVFASMFYAAGKIRNDAPADALKDETL